MVMTKTRMMWTKLSVNDDNDDNDHNIDNDDHDDDDEDDDDEDDDVNDNQRRTLRYDRNLPYKIENKDGWVKMAKIRMVL